MLKRERRRVVGAEPVGPYTLLRVDRGGLEPGVPGQFFMLEARGRVLPRPMSLCLAPQGELGFLFEPIGPGTRALAALGAGDELAITCVYTTLNRHDPVSEGESIDDEECASYLYVTQP